MQKIKQSNKNIGGKSIESNRIWLWIARRTNSTNTNRIKRRIKTNGSKQKKQHNRTQNI